jgi:hypothetical protein
MSNGEAPVVAAERSWLILAHCVLDALVSKCPLTDHVALAKGVGAAPSIGEGEVSVVGNILAVFEIRPVKAALLLVAALVVGVFGCLVITEKIPSSNGSLGSEPSDQKSICGLHYERSSKGLDRTGVVEALKER